MLGMPNGMEWVIIAVVVLVLFGGTKLASLGKNAGKAIREFKEETATGKNPTASVEPPVPPVAPAPPASPAAPAADSEPPTDLR
jgi:sec-independent protein translocase protein TatA